MSDVITIENLSKTYKTRKKNKDAKGNVLKRIFKLTTEYVHAVNDISLRVAKAEVRGLIGPNGAGKSTTIKIISGVLFPSSGAVNVLGFVPWKQRRAYVQNIGVVFGQKTQLWWDLPAVETFDLNRTMYRIPKDKYKRNLEYFYDTLKIAEVARKPVRQLSLGERMKCEFACALLHDPSIVFLDEPTIGLDIVAKDAIRTFIRETNRTKSTTFIITTHDLDDIEDLCNNVSIINHGKIVYDGSIDGLYTVFSNTKVIDLTLSRAVSAHDLAGFQVLQKEDLVLKIQVDVSQKKIREHINDIMERLPVHDININSVDIETVIKEFYQRKADG